jgi:hypothetical protein
MLMKDYALSAIPLVLHLLSKTKNRQKIQKSIYYTGPRNTQHFYT